MLGLLAQQIMESLGGDQAWFDRFLAEHAAIMYYWMLIGMYLVSPKLAYNFMQRVEHHAADVYGEQYAFLSDAAAMFTEHHRTT
jgi:hypothetical protein